MFIEIELKLRIAAQDIQRLRNHLMVEYPNIIPKDDHLFSTYFDTADHVLRQHGFGLRIRQVGGKLLQTLKDAGERLGDLRYRKEYEHEVSVHTPDIDLLSEPELREQLTQLIANRSLVPLFTTEFQRTSWNFFLNDHTQIELAIDQGQIRAGSRSEPIDEVELELKKGDIAKLNELADSLCKVVPLQVEHRSKAERGYQLCVL